MSGVPPYTHKTVKGVLQASLRTPFTVLWVHGLTLITR